VLTDDERVERKRQSALRRVDEHRAWDREYCQRPEVKLRRLGWAREHADRVNERRREQYATKVAAKRAIDTDTE